MRLIQAVRELIARNPDVREVFCNYDDYMQSGEARGDQLMFASLPGAAVSVDTFSEVDREHLTVTRVVLRPQREVPRGEIWSFIPDARGLLVDEPDHVVIQRDADRRRARAEYDARRARTDRDHCRAMYEMEIARLQEQNAKLMALLARQEALQPRTIVIAGPPTPKPA